jgi:hypothetical protein
MLDGGEREIDPRSGITADRLPGSTAETPGAWHDLWKLTVVSSLGLARRDSPLGGGSCDGSGSCAYQKSIRLKGVHCSCELVTRGMGIMG